MNLAKRYVIGAGEPLSHRRMQELFMEAARRLAQVHPQAWGDQQFSRADFASDAWDEYDVSKATGMQFDVPSMGRLVPATLALEATREPAWNARLQWSLEGVVLATYGYLCLGVPVFNQNLCWAGQDFVTADQPLFTVVASTPDDTDANTAYSLTGTPAFCLGGEVQVPGATSYSSAGILMMSIGEFRISKAYLTLQRSVL